MITVTTLFVAALLFQDKPQEEDSGVLRERIEKLEKQLREAREQLERLLPGELRMGRRLADLWKAAQSLGERLEGSGEKEVIEKAAKAAGEAWRAMSDDDKKRSLQRFLDFYDALPSDVREDLFKRTGPEVFKRFFPPRPKKKEKRDY